MGGKEAVVEVVPFEYNSPRKFGVMVGIGVNMLFATAVAREAISADCESRSNKTSIMRSRLAF